MSPTTAYYQVLTQVEKNVGDRAYEFAQEKQAFERYWFSLNQDQRPIEPQDATKFTIHSSALQTLDNQDWLLVDSNLNGNRIIAFAHPAIRSNSSWTELFTCVQKFLHNCTQSLLILEDFLDQWCTRFFRTSCIRQSNDPFPNASFPVAIFISANVLSRKEQNRW
jgi:hypothetical protein